MNAARCQLDFRETAGEESMVRKLGIAACAAITVMVFAGTQTHAAKQGEKCGGLGGIQCDRGLWCDPAPGQCGVQDAEGVCIKIPRFCPLAKKGTRVVLPVCGCNKRTYSNDCDRQRQKVPKNHDGAC
jgi:hypothetical protein